MPVESATFVDDLDASQPPGTDPKSQGDNHLRLIKEVLKNTFKRATRSISVPSAITKTASYNVVIDDDNQTIVCNTGAGPITLTLPVLTAAEAGWSFFIQKSSTDANPVFLVPPAGLINGFSKVRRSIEFVVTRIAWNGVSFVASRPNGVPIGSCIEYWGGSLPNGHLWPDGGTFVAADFVELQAILATNVKPDRGGRVAVCRDDIGGTVTNRITVGVAGIDGTALRQGCGFEGIPLAAGHLPAHRHAVYLNDPQHRHQINSPNSAVVSGGGLPRIGTGSGGDAVQTDLATTGITVRDTAGGGGTADRTSHVIVQADGTPVNGADLGFDHNNMQPSVISNFVLVAE